jgi:hypothetical protein
MALKIIPNKYDNRKPALGDLSQIVIRKGTRPIQANQAISYLGKAKSNRIADSRIANIGHNRTETLALNALNTSHNNYRYRLEPGAILPTLRLFLLNTHHDDG